MKQHRQWVGTIRQTRHIFLHLDLSPVTRFIPRNKLEFHTFLFSSSCVQSPDSIVTEYLSFTVKNFSINVLPT